MMKIAWIIAIACTLGSATAAHAAGVTFHRAVDNATGPVDVQFGDTAIVGIWATVSGKTHTLNDNAVDLGLLALNRGPRWRKG